MEISQAEVQVLLPPFISTIQEIVTTSWSDYNSKYVATSSIHTPACRAAIIRDHMVHHARRLFDGMKDTHIIERGGLFLVELRSLGRTVILRFKKHTKDGRTRNYPTEQAKNYNTQTFLEFTPKEAARLDVGWQPNQLFTDFRTLISHPRGVGLDPWWVIDLLAPAITGEIPAGTQLQIPEKKKQKRVHVKFEPIRKIADLNNE